MNERNLLIYLSVKYKGDYNSIYEAIQKHEDMPEDEVREALQQIKSGCITILDEDYPEYLRTNVCRPPFVIYYYGDISLLKDDQKNIAFIGSRICTPYGENITVQLVNEACENFNIVSGLAKGIDSCAHNACINKIGKTIAVLGCGIDYCYPEENRKLYEIIKQKGLVISEYPGETSPQPHYFPFRNRLIVGISRAVVITEAKRRSGTAISTFYALETGKDVCCVPYPIKTNSLCNRLIKQGAYLIENVKDLYSAIGYEEEEPVFDL